MKKGFLRECPRCTCNPVFTRRDLSPHPRSTEQAPRHEVLTARPCSPNSKSPQYGRRHGCPGGAALSSLCSRTFPKTFILLFPKRVVGCKVGVGILKGYHEVSRSQKTKKLIFPKYQDSTSMQIRSTKIHYLLNAWGFIFT